MKVGDKVSVILPLWAQWENCWPMVLATVVQLGNDHCRKVLVKYQGEHGTQLDWIETRFVRPIVEI